MTYFFLLFYITEGEAR